MHDDEGTGSSEEELDVEWMTLEREQQELTAELHHSFQKAHRDTERLRREFEQELGNILMPCIDVVDKYRCIAKDDVSE